MLDILHLVEDNFADLIADKDAWKTKCIDYEPPIVHRIYRDWLHGGVSYRVYQHLIFPNEKALYHKHPWSSAIRVIGLPPKPDDPYVYEMGIGFGVGDSPPPIAATIRVPRGFEYEMVHPDGWHWVRAVGAPSSSLMVTGPEWARDEDAATKRMNLRALTQEEIVKVRRPIYSYYGL